MKTSIGILLALVSYPVYFCVNTFFMFTFKGIIHAIGYAITFVQNTRPEAGGENRSVKRAYEIGFNGIVMNDNPIKF
jgi:hypothetical protein